DLVIRQALKPAVHDDAYAGFYDFLNKHANIRVAVSQPDVAFATQLKPAGVNPPNIFLFVIDALRRDYISPYNSAVNFTPHIQAWADDSIVFQNAYTPYAGTALAEPAICDGFQQLHAPYRAARATNLQRVLDAGGFDCYISSDEVLYTIVPRSPNVTVLSSHLTH